MVMVAVALTAGFFLINTVILTVPPSFNVTRPLLSTVAILVSLDIHVNSGWTLVDGWTTAFSWSVLSANWTVALSGVMVIPLVFPWTVTLQVPIIAFSVLITVMVATPSPTPLITAFFPL